MRCSWQSSCHLCHKYKPQRAEAQVLPSSTKRGSLSTAPTKKGSQAYASICVKPWTQGITREGIFHSPCSPTTVWGWRSLAQWTWLTRPWTSQPSHGQWRSQARHMQCTFHSYPLRECPPFQKERSKPIMHEGLRCQATALSTLILCWVDRLVTS